MNKTLPLLAGASILALCGFAQSWDQAYDAGIKAAHAGHWPEARQDFLAAAKDRPTDSSRESMLPGSPTDPQRWRDGAAYSPNFLAAYCAYRAGVDSHDLAEQSKLFGTAATELSHLVSIGEYSRDAFFFLDLIYSRLGDEPKRTSCADLAKKEAKRLKWRVDEEIVAPEEVAAISVSGAADQVVAGPSHVPVVSAAQLANPSGLTSAPMTTATAATKFALVIGETGTKLGSGQVLFAANDVAAVRDSLVNSAGYPAANVVTVVDAPAAAVLDAAKKLASGVAQDGVVLIYYVGPGSSLHGKDYLAGSDAESLDDPTTMVRKLDLYNCFFAQGAKVFAFYEVNRPIVNQYFFGSELPQSGAVSQMEATIPDSSLTSLTYKGNQIGLFALSFSNVLGNLRSSRVPIHEFGWLVYQQMRRGTSSGDSGSGPQTPTLPIVNMLDSEARF